MTRMFHISACLAVTAVSIFGADGSSSSGSTGAVIVSPPSEFFPMTSNERFGSYINGLVSYEAVLTSAASGAISQASNKPEEWGGGGEAFGKRIGNAYAEHFIRGTLQYGASYFLHEDNRYFVSRESGFFRRTKYAVVSTFLARHDNGSRSLSFSRIGSTAGAAFISRAWQPPSTTTAGDAAINFGIGMATQAGFNVVREFMPDVRRRLHR